MMEQGQTWEDVKEIWGNSSKGAKINFQVSELIDELKGKVSQFEKDSIKSDIFKIKSSWLQYKKKVSRYEKDSIKNDLSLITNLLKKLINRFKSKNE